MAANTLAPSLKTIARRVRALSDRENARANQLSGPTDKRDLHPNHHLVLRPLEEVQIDHTLMDVMVDLREFGLGVRRPWLTLAVDVATRMVFGYYIGLKAPSVKNSMLVLMQGLIEKKKWLENKGLNFDRLCSQAGVHPWPIEGVPIRVHTDRGSDFTSRKLADACRSLGIQLVHRPPGGKHYGGHIERLIGTFMRRLRGLPGATKASVRERANYDAEKKACFTLNDLELWLILEVLRYHSEPHSTLRCSPLQRYAELSNQIPKPVSALSVDDIYLAFLDKVGRKVGPTGVKIGLRNYYHDDLLSLDGKYVWVLHGGWDDRRVHISLDGKSIYQTLTLCPDGHPSGHPDLKSLKTKETVNNKEDDRQHGFARELRLTQLQLVDQVKERKKQTPLSQSPSLKIEEKSEASLLDPRQVPIFPTGKGVL